MKQILCFGDSNTYGLIPGETGRYPWGVRWTSLLEEGVSDRGYRVIEEGLCGRTTVFADELREGRRGVDYLPTILETHAPVEIVILMLGTNDCKTVFGASAGVIAQGMEKLIMQVRNHRADMPVLVMSPIHLGEEVWKEEFDPEFSKERILVSWELEKHFRRLAEKYHCGFLAASDYAEPSKVDQEHLDEAGHKALAGAVKRKLLELGYISPRQTGTDFMLIAG